MALRIEALFLRCLNMPEKTDVLTCVLVVAAALLVGFAKCVGCTSRFPD